MVKIILSGLLTLLTLQSSVLADTRREDDITWVTDNVGGPHGQPFDDSSFVNAANGHRRISKITLGPCEKGVHLQYMRLEFKDWRNPKSPPTFVEHGKMKPAHVAAMSIGATDYITNIVMRTWQDNAGFTFRTRLASMDVSTKDGKAIHCGAWKDDLDVFTWPAPDGQGLLYFSGAQHDAIDNLTGHFMRQRDF